MTTAVKLTTSTSHVRFADVLRNRQDFKTGGSLTGERGSDRGFGGSLPQAFLSAVRSAEYVVYSYTTPIAWLNADGTWTVPDVKYSVTTSRHQSKIRSAVKTLEDQSPDLRRSESSDLLVEG